MTVKIKNDPFTFMDPGLTDSQGNQVFFRYTSTAWGGHILQCPTGPVFSGDAYKRFLSWLVGK